MSKPNYRVNLTFDGERKIFLASCPELEHCSAEGASRAEATGKLEEEIDAQLANMLSHGTQPPKSVDEEVFSGQITAKVSKELHREMVFQSRSEGIEIDQLLGELLAAAMEGRKSTPRGQRSGNRQPQEHVPHDSIGNRHDGRGDRPPQRGGFQRGHNPQLLDDRANFIEYVRGLEQSGGHPGHNRGGHGGGPGGGGVGPGGDRGRRRGRGGSGGGSGGGRPGGGPGGDRGNQPYRNDRQMQGGPNNGGNGGPRNGGPPQANPGAPASAPPSTPGNGGAPSGNPGGGGSDDGNA